MKSTSRDHLIVVGAIVAILAVPMQQCGTALWNINRLKSSIAATSQESEAVLQEIEQVHGAKEMALVEAGKRLNELEGRVARNQNLFNETADAQKKLDLVRNLREEYQRIAKTLGNLRSQFPELTSGE